jgi:hypothetical protein
MRRTPKISSAEINGRTLEQQPISLSERVLRCAQELHHAACLAAIAAQGAEPEDGAQLLVSTMDDLSADFRELRSATKGLIVS